MKWVYVLFFMVIGAVIVLHFFPQINFRSMPEGLCTAQLNKDKPNWVSSLIDKTDSHYIKPFHAEGLDMKKLAQCIDERFKDVTLVKSDGAQIIAYRRSSVFNFIDWFCIKANGDVTSSATMGHSDLGKNRELIEEIRTSCTPGV